MTSRLELAGYLTSLKDRLERFRVFRIAVVNQVATIPQKAPLVHADVTRHLLHPAFIRVPSDAGNDGLASFDVYEKQNVIGDQAAKPQHLYAQEVGRRQNRPVPSNEFGPGR